LIFNKLFGFVAHHFFCLKIKEQYNLIHFQ